MGHASFESSPSLRPRQIGTLAAGAILGMLGFLVASRLSGHFGFPLDDSWIHATYARNLALSGQWVFRPGVLSAGSTSPLWTLLLVPGYWLGLAPLWWSHALGCVCLAALAIVTEQGLRKLSSAYRPQVPWAGLLVATEWHLVWASVSGMETLLHAALVTTVLMMLLTESRRYSAMGLLTGLCIWVRPDGLTIAPVVLLAVVFFSDASSSKRWRALLAYSLGLGALLLPYVVFNLTLAGTPFPNTFYAKQAEYAAWQGRSIFAQIGSGVLQLSTGPLLLLWPALGLQIGRAGKAHRFPVLAILAWCLGYMAMYVMRLPPYQHARYLIPALPMLLVIGFWGVLRYHDVQWPRARHWMVEWAWRASLVLAQIGFLILGARAYAEDVALIQTEMIGTANWVAENLPSQAVVAAHDIGALGYLDSHELIDLAGLVSPEVIPFIRDEDRLAAYLDSRHATHLIAFPGLYPELVQASRLLFSSGGPIAPALGQGNMSVYCWRCP